MKTKVLLSLVIVTVLSVSFFACQKMEDDVTPQATTLDLPTTPYDYSTVNFGGTMSHVSVDNDQVTLGRVLFYDTRLSVNNAIACASCHQQGRAFSDDVSFSTGFENKKTTRNSLPIQNISNGGVFTFQQSKLFWDGRANFLNSMVLMPMLNHVEMGMSDVNAIADKVRAIPYYKELFVKAYNSSDISSEKIAEALGSFVGSIFSMNNRFDQVSNSTGPNTGNGSTVRLSPLEEEGHDLFFSKYNCNSCHQTQQMVAYQTGGGEDPGFVNIGLETNYSDKGLQALSQDPADNGKFKIPSLRNIALTGPYMHDGRFATLNDVLEHYSHGIKDHPSLDSRLRDEVTGQPKQLNITSHEKTAIIAFLNTMTDYSMITDPKFSNPFKVVR